MIKEEMHYSVFSNYHHHQNIILFHYIKNTSIAFATPARPREVKQKQKASSGV